MIPRVIVHDNLSAHTAPPVKEVLAAAGHVDVTIRMPMSTPVLKIHFLSSKASCGSTATITYITPTNLAHYIRHSIKLITPEMCCT